MIWFVIQHGGSSSEVYLHDFYTEKDANDYIEDAEASSYRCDGPFSFSITPMERWHKAVIRAALEWWRAKSGIFPTDAEHLKQPLENCAYADTPLATAVANMIKADAKKRAQDRIDRAEWRKRMEQRRKEDDES